MRQVEYSEGDRGPEATVFEVVFPPGRTPNILLEESQPGNKVGLILTRRVRKVYSIGAVSKDGFDQGVLRALFGGTVCPG